MNAIGSPALNRHLIDSLDAADIEFESISKSEKIRLLARWSAVFSGLSAFARQGTSSADVLVDTRADAFLASQTGVTIFLLPNDESAMPSVRCHVRAIPDLTELLADTYTTCEEIVIIEEGFTWSCVLLNHGAAGVGRYAAMARRPGGN